MPLTTNKQLERVAWKAIAADRRAMAAQRMPRPHRISVIGPPILSAITDWQPISGVKRWRYGWEQVWLNGASDTFESVPGGIRGTFLNGGTTYALNMTEAFNIADHTGTQGNSINEIQPGFPAGFHVLPVGGGANGVPTTSVVVWMWATTSSTGLLRYVFEYINAEDGTCT